MKITASNSMKFLVGTLVSALVTYAIGLYGNLPWWSFAISNFIIAILITQTPLKSFLSGALGVGLTWLTLAIIIDQQNHHLLSGKVATILPLNGSYVALIAITTFVGFLIGGLSALAGSYVRKSA